MSDGCCRDSTTTTTVNEVRRRVVVVRAIDQGHDDQVQGHDDQGQGHATDQDQDADRQFGQGHATAPGRGKGQHQDHALNQGHDEGQVHMTAATLEAIRSSRATIVVVTAARPNNASAILVLVIDVVLLYRRRRHRHRGSDVVAATAVDRAVRDHARLVVVVGTDRVDRRRRVLGGGGVGRREVATPRPSGELSSTEAVVDCRRRVKVVPVIAAPCAGLFSFTEALPQKIVRRHRNIPANEMWEIVRSYLIFWCKFTVKIKPPKMLSCVRNGTIAKRKIVRYQQQKIKLKV